MWQYKQWYYIESKTYQRSSLNKHNQSFNLTSYNYIVNNDNTKHVWTFPQIEVSVILFYISWTILTVWALSVLKLSWHNIKLDIPLIVIIVCIMPYTYI